MSESADAHVRARDELASVALGESVDTDVTDHVAGCPACQDELRSYADVVETARTGRLGDPSVEPPPRVWDAIAAEVVRTTSNADLNTQTALPASPPSSPRRARRTVLAALAAAAVVAAALAGWLVGRDRSGPDHGPSARAALAAQSGTSADAHGIATMRAAAGGYEMDVRTAGLPAPSGYYEVWLFDPSANRMVAIGTLGTGGRGTFTVPAGIDTAAYHVVDVSAQRYDGNAAHERSVLRGALST